VARRLLLSALSTPRLMVSEQHVLLVKCICIVVWLSRMDARRACHAANAPIAGTGMDMTPPVGFADPLPDEGEWPPSFARSTHVLYLLLPTHG
jgi:hypothetical protein